ncbi:hypothetical protein [Janibacter terrae]|nr:hypothetical protein [Janibacter terrae]
MAKLLMTDSGIDFDGVLAAGRTAIDVTDDLVTAADQVGSGALRARPS